MSSNTTQKLWSHLRDPVSHFLAPKTTGLPRKSPFSNPIFAPDARSFSWSRPRIQQTPSKRSISKSFASCSFLFIDISPTTTATASGLTSCTAVAEKSLYATSKIPRQTISSLAQQAWRRQIHSSTRRRERGSLKRNKSSTTDEHIVRKPQQNNNTPKAAPVAKKPETPEPDTTSTGYLHLPHMHRPTKEEFLSAATGFWSRLKVRFKWFSIRSVRPWNIDDWSAFVSWFVLGNIVWILVGTTTFMSLVILSINTVVAQGIFIIAPSFG